MTFLEEARRFEPKQDDKLQKLIRLLKSKEIADEKILIFTEFADTARYLKRQLDKAGVEGVCQVDSATKGNRADVIRRFSPYYNGSSSPELANVGQDETRGHVIGNVAKLNNNDQWQTYVAAGDLIMNWEFSCRKGELTIANFDGRNFGTGARGLAQIPSSLNQFTGTLAQLGPNPDLQNLSGRATGSFMRGAPTQVLGAPTDTLTSIRGVAGNWNIGANGYKAGGIFAGSGVPTAHAH